MKKIFLATGLAVVTSAVAVLLIPGQKATVPASELARTAPLVIQDSAHAATSPTKQPHTAQQQGSLATATATDSEIGTVPPLAEPVVSARPPRLDFWRLSANSAKRVTEGLPAEELTVDLKQLQTLHVGQTVSFELPDGKGPIESEITDTYNDSTGVQVWTGQIKNDVRHASVIITQGTKQTHVVIASTRGNYSGVIDRQTGAATLINESAIQERQQLIEDGIVYRPGEGESETHQH